MHDAVRLQFAELLRRHRASTGLSQLELARLSGLSDRALRDLEQGRRVPRVQSARLVAKALKLTGDDLTAFLAVGPSAPTPVETVVPDDGRIVASPVVYGDRLFTVIGSADDSTRTLVEFDATEKIFSNPADERTENYVTGRFG